MCFTFAGVKEIDIAATLEHVRDQRPGMVRTKVRGNAVKSAGDGGECSQISADDLHYIKKIIY